MSDEIDRLKLAHQYAWDWFAYHASQRMIIFRFFFVVIALVAAGYYQTLANAPHLAMAFSVLGVLLTFFFWRLDRRTRELIEIGEDHLLYLEPKLSSSTAHDVSIIKLARSKRQGETGSRLPHSYREIFLCIFVSLGIACLLAAIYAALRLWWK